MMRRHLGRAGFVVAALLVLCTASWPAGARAARQRVVVVGASSRAAAAAVADAGGTVTRDLPIIDGVAAHVESSRLRDLAADPRVVAVAPDEIVRLASDDEETNASTVNSVFTREINADHLWAEGIDGRGIRVAVVDTGISEVPDLTGRIVPVFDPSGGGSLVPCANFSGEPTCADSYGHGTFVAGLIAGNGSASGGMYRGVAPAAELVSVKIAGRDGSADVSKVLAAIQWVVSFSRELNIKVLNLSLGTNSKVSYRFDPLNVAVERAWLSGVTVVVSAGNRGPERGTISKPADDPFVVTVSSVDDRETPGVDDDRLPRFSSRGPAFAGTSDELAKPDVVAPGGRVISLRAPGSYVEEHAPGGFPSDTYRRGSGTSMSAGIVSGAAALLLQANPDWEPNRTKFALTATARKVAERDPFGVGAGLIDAYAAARAAPAGVANQHIVALSSGTGSLDGSRGDVYVSRECVTFERLLDPQCDRVHGQRTAQDKMYEANEYASANWTGSSWYSSQWVAGLDGSSWYGSSWYACNPPSPELASCWYGSSWYGSSWYGSNDNAFYGTSVAGSSWYGAWE